MKRTVMIALFCMLGASSLAVAAESEGVRVATIVEGDGPVPAASDTVRVHYRGMLVDGTEFDSSVSRGPATFGLGQVIPCWTAGLQQMRVGETAQLVCPPTFAYGARGVPGLIPPDSTLVFEVELLEIVGH